MVFITKALAASLLVASAVTAFIPTSRGPSQHSSRITLSARARRVGVAARKDSRRSGVVMSSVSVGEVSGLKRVVVTGMGITSCLGNSIDDVKDSLYNAKCGLKYSKKYEHALPTRMIC